MATYVKEKIIGGVLNFIIKIGQGLQDRHVKEVLVQNERPKSGMKIFL